MNLLSQILCLQLLILCMDDQDFVTNLYCCIILLHLISSFSHTIFLLIPYAYVSINSIDCILVSSSELKAIYLIFNFFSKNIMPCTYKSLLGF